MSKIYTRVHWENRPSRNTALEAINLNKMDAGIDALDTLVDTINSTTVPAITADISALETNVTGLQSSVSTLQSNVTTINGNITSLQSGKVDKVNGKGLSTNDFTDTLKDKLDGIESGAEVNVQSDYAQEDTTADDYIKNKPMSVEKSATSSFKTINGGLLTKCVVDLEPIQDLHGYDYPWVGGAGKNKLPMTVDDIKSRNTQGTWSGNSTTISDVTFTINTDSDGNVTGISTDGTSSTLIQFQITGAVIPSTFEGKVLNGCPSGGSTSTYRLLCLENGTSKAIDTGSGATISGMSANNSIQIRINSGTNMSGKVFYPMIRNSSESATFAPYSNECSINGHTEVDIKRDGKNLLPMTVASIKALNTAGTWNGNTYTYKMVDLTILTDNSDNVIGIDVTGTASSNLTHFIIAQNLTFSEAIIFSCGFVSTWNRDGYVCEVTDGTTVYTPSEISGVEIPSGTYTVRFAVKSSTTVTHKILLPMIRLATETDATFEPYKGELKVINLNGTYYGVRGDAVSGEWEVVSVIVDLGTLTYTQYNTYQSSTKKRFGAPITPLPKAVATTQDTANILCSSYKTVTAAQIYARLQGISIGTDGGVYIYDEALSESSVSDFTTAMNGVQLCYELATPIPLSLTPTQIESLVGVNYIDTPLDGQSIETDGIGYKELFGWDDVVNYVQSVINA